MRTASALCFVALSLATLPAPAGQPELATAASLVEASGRTGGVCAVVQPPSPALPIAIARSGGFVVHCLYAEPDACDRARQAIRASGLYGTVSADTFDGSHLPYADRLVNVLVLGPGAATSGPLLAEVARVLAPLGAAFVPTPAGGQGDLAARARKLGLEPKPATIAGAAWLVLRKPWPPTIDEWTHYLHGPDGNPVARDTEVGPPRHLQWVCEPRWLRSHETVTSVSTMVTARGRLFAIVDEAPISLAGQHSPPDKWCLLARDAFNGVLLWKVPIRRWGWREWKSSWFSPRPGDIPLNLQKRLVAAGDRLFVTLGYRAPVSQLDARTGRILKTYPQSEFANEILFLDGTLLCSRVEGENEDRLRVLAIDADSGKTLWTSRSTYAGSTVDYYRWRAMRGAIKPARVHPASNIATDGRVVALLDGKQIACLDLKSGAEKWKAPFPIAPEDLRAGGIRSNGNLWVGTLIVAHDAIVHASPYVLAAFDAKSGKLLWKQPKRYIGHLWYEWKDVFVIGNLVWTWSADVPTEVVKLPGGRKLRTRGPTHVNAYDIRTGRLVRSLPLGNVFKTHHHHRCYRNKATTRYILASRRGTEFIDLLEGKHTVDNWVRGACHHGMMPANGLQNVPPHPCQCYIEEKLTGMLALAHSRTTPPTSGSRLVRGPAYAQPLEPPAATPEDWPTFRHDPAHTASTAATIPEEPKLLWRVRLGRKVSPPTVVGDRVFVALVDEHAVACLDARTGRKLWDFTTGARVDSQPTWHRGTLLFGSADGAVYCLRAADGALLWRFQAAPADLRIAAFGQLESPWPVHGSVLVLDGVAYFAAGRSSHLDGGLFIYALDPATGKLLHEARLEGPYFNVQNIEAANYLLPQGALNDIMMAEGRTIFLRYKAFDPALKPVAAKPSLLPRGGFLDDTYFKRIPWTLDGAYARLIAHDGKTACYIRMFDSLRGLDPKVYFTPGKKGYLLFARDITRHRDLWKQRVPIRVTAMVKAPGRLAIAGPPDTVPRKDPLGAFEGRLGALLWIVDVATGKPLSERKLPSPPVFNGAAAARGRLYLSARDGAVACYGD